MSDGAKFVTVAFAPLWIPALLVLGIVGLVLLFASRFRA